MVSRPDDGAGFQACHGPAERHVGGGQAYSQTGPHQTHRDFIGSHSKTSGIKFRLPGMTKPRPLQPLLGDRSIDHGMNLFPPQLSDTFFQGLEGGFSSA